ncbi:reverse transcriptase domain-containing protein [Tanacetum coccineum]|uniref:Reverse transcriptase domain-containing protein n=1 Tax=Tanacetum coccineum TaxID=301880 RepID=A0ABQ5BGT3_9ASTR
MQDHRIDAQDSLIAALTAQVSSLQGHLATALGKIRALQARDQACADAPEGTASTAVGLVFSFLVSDNHNNMPPRRTSTTARVAAAAAAAAAPMTVAAVEQLIEARVSAALANLETLRNSTNGHGDRSHNSDIGNRGTTRTPRECTYKDFLNCHPLNFKGTEGVVVLGQWFEKMESVFYISNCAVENQVKFATCTFVGNALTWWNSHMKAITQDVAYVMDWKTLKKMMTVKYCPMELALMCGRIFPEESDEVEKYVGGLPDMIRGNVMSYRPQTMEEAIEFANDQMDQKLITITERQAEQKRKLEFNVGNNQGHQQQNTRHNTRRAYTAGPGEKREYTGSLPLCTKCNYHHKGPCAPRCNKCKKIGHLARDCRSSGPNGNNNNRGNSGTTQNAGTCYECGVQGHFKRDCPKLKNKNHGNQGGNGNAPAKVYVVGNARTNPDSNVVTGMFLLNNRYASILFDTGADRSFVSTTFSSLIDITPTTLDHYYDVKLADGKIIRINTIIQGCTLNFLDHPFNFNLMPIELGSFDVIVGMDWLAKYHVVIDCAEKIVMNVNLESAGKATHKHKNDLTAYYESVGITHEKTITRTPQQNGVVERRNRNLVEAARTMLIFSKAPMLRQTLGSLFVTHQTRRVTESTANELAKSWKPFMFTFVELELGHNTVNVHRYPSPVDHRCTIGKSFTTCSDHQSSSVHHGVAADHSFEVNPFASANPEPFVNVFSPDPSSEASSSGKQLATDSLWCFYNSVLSKVEPKNFKAAITEDCWFQAMQEEIHEFDRLDVWELVPSPDCAMIIALKWIYKESLSPVTRLEAIRIFIANAASKNMTAQGFSKGVVDPTLFIRKTGKHTYHVQIYVDDIIFALTDPRDYDRFYNEMSSKFQMSIMGQMSFFLGLQISQNPIGIFINQSKYANEILKKFDLHKSDPVDTPMVERTKLDEDLSGIPVDQTRYRSMVGCLMNHTASRPDLVFAVCMCARYQSMPTKKHLEAIKRVFRYLQGTINMGIWYLKDTAMALTVYADADHAGCQDTRRSTSGTAQFLADKEQVENGVVELYFVRTEYQLADIFTKALPRERFEFILSRLGMKCMKPETLKRIQDEKDE